MLWTFEGMIRDRDFCCRYVIKNKDVSLIYS